jgi:hypothetical protein
MIRVEITKGGIVLETAQFATLELAIEWHDKHDSREDRFVNFHYYNEDDADPVQPLADADFHWTYRVVGYNGNGSVEFNARVKECEQPPTADDLKAIEQMHERALGHPGVRTATTIGPMRERLRGS